MQNYGEIVIRQLNGIDGMLLVLVLFAIVHLILAGLQLGELKNIADRLKRLDM